MRWRRRRVILLAPFGVGAIIPLLGSTLDIDEISFFFNFFIFKIMYFLLRTDTFDIDERYWHWWFFSFRKHIYFGDLWWKKVRVFRIIITIRKWIANVFMRLNHRSRIDTALILLRQGLLLEILKVFDINLSRIMQLFWKHYLRA